MKNVVAILFVTLFLSSRNKDSSPEGRMQIRIDAMEKKVDSLQNQNTAILENLNELREELKVIRQKNSAIK